MNVFEFAVRRWVKFIVLAILTGMWWTAVLSSDLPGRPATEGQIAVGEALAVGTLCVLGTWALIALVEALAGARRAVEWLRCGSDPKRPDEMAAALESPSEPERRRAVQVLADYYGHPFGRVECWPWVLHDTSRVDVLTAIYGKWWRKQKSVTKAEAARLAVAKRRAVEVGAAPGEAEGAGRAGFPEGERQFWTRRVQPLYEEALRRKPPPLVYEPFLEAMRGKFEKALWAVTDAINGVPGRHTVHDCEAVVRNVFVAMRWEALRCGWQMRLGSGGEGAEPSPEEGDSGPAPATGNWVEKFRRLRSGSAGPSCAANESLAAANQETPAGAAEPSPAASWDERVRLMQAKLDQTLERVADAVKNSLLEWDLLPPELRGPQNSLDHLPPVAREEFADALRGRVEETLRRVADAVNEGSHEEQVRILLAELLWDAVDAGVRLRSRAVEPASSASSESSSFTPSSEASR
jgi:hypothetical protein